MPNLFATKPLSLLNAEANEEGEHTLKRSLSALNLITLGIGAIIGAGIFVLTGQAAATHAGPAVALELRPGRDCVRLRGALLRGVRLHHSHCGFGLHVWLCNPR